MMKTNILLKGGKMNFIKIFLILIFLFINTICFASEDKNEKFSDVSISPATKACIGCHINFTPGIVKDWFESRHSKTAPETVINKPDIEKRISSPSIPAELSSYAVGCYECHSLNAEKHKDTFNHMSRNIHIVVTPEDCKTCHVVEVQQFSISKKSYAHKILMDNTVYRLLTDTVTGIKKHDIDKLILEKPSDSTLHETCLGCHGTVIDVVSTKNISTKIGIMTVPDLKNWPNQGVGRINPDGSRGSCSACHARHSFSIEVARKPYTCGQCHHEPDVPAWNVYEESKHGNIFSSLGKNWNFTNVPWKIGKDIKAPTCSTCHNSLLVSPEGEIISERTHDFGSRLWVRLFGLIYSHPQPKSGDTTIIKNKDGLPLPVTFSNEPATEYLIDKDEQIKRQRVFSNICNSCHSSQWIKGHFSKMDSTINETNTMSMTATSFMLEIWKNKFADNSNPFDESIEQMWIKQWLFYSNSIRYSSAMTGAPDYTTFKNGWWDLTENLQKMKDWLDLKKEIYIKKQ